MNLANVRSNRCCTAVALACSPRAERIAGLGTSHSSLLGWGFTPSKAGAMMLAVSAARPMVL